MDKLYYPKSIVIFGISGKPNNIPKSILENLIRWRYSGRIFGVNPVSDEVHVDGVKMYKRVEDLPVVPDLAIALIPARFVPETIDACGKFGITRMAIPAGGFNELGERGKELAKSTLAIAQKHGIRFVGPNGLTVANTDNGLCVPFVPLYMPPKGSLSIITQSGGLGLMLWNLLAEENVGMAKFASIGNKLDLDEVDFLEYFGRDPKTRVICLYLESITRGRELCKVAAAIDKPVIVLKSNTTATGQLSAVSHTAAVSNNDELVDSAFEQAGIIRIDNFADFISVTKTFELPPMRGNRIMLMSPAGGFTVMMADLSEKLGFELADPGDAFYKELEKSSNAGIISFSNPLDMGDIYDPKMYTHTFHSVMHNEKVDGAVYVSQWPEMPHGEDHFHKMFHTDISNEVIGSVLSSNKPLGICLFGQSETTHRIKTNMSIPVFNTLEEMMRGLRLQSNFYAKKTAGRDPVVVPGGIEQTAAEKWFQAHAGSVGEEALEVLHHFGIPCATSQMATSESSAVEIANELGYPVVLKVVSPDALHKTESGGVILNIDSDDHVKTGMDQIKNNLFHFKADADFQGVRVMKQVGEGHDMFVGGLVDNTFGPFVFFGFGGIYVEVFKDVQNAPCPTTRGEIAAKVAKLKSHAILAGIRGKQATDIEGFIEIILRVSHLMSQFPELKEIDLNPVRLPADGSKAVTLDVRLRIERS